MARKEHDKVGYELKAAAHTLESVAGRAGAEATAGAAAAVAEARLVLERLPTLGINLDQVTQQLEDDGVEKFNQPFDQLTAALGRDSRP